MVVALNSNSASVLIMCVVGAAVVISLYSQTSSFSCQLGVAHTPWQPGADPFDVRANANITNFKAFLLQQVLHPQYGSFRQWQGRVSGFCQAPGQPTHGEQLLSYWRVKPAPALAAVHSFVNRRTGTGLRPS